MTVHNDTVEKAQSTPDEQQPYAELGSVRHNSV